MLRIVEEHHIHFQERPDHESLHMICVKPNMVYKQDLHDWKLSQFSALSWCRITAFRFSLLQLDWGNTLSAKGIFYNSLIQRDWQTKFDFL